MTLHALDVLLDRQARLSAPMALKDLGLAERLVLLQEFGERNGFLAVLALDREVLGAHVAFGIPVSDRNEVILSA